MRRTNCFFPCQENLLEGMVADKIVNYLGVYLKNILCTSTISKILLVHIKSSHMDFGHVLFLLENKKNGFRRREI